MATESSGFDEAMDVGTSTISHLKTLKTASTIAKAGFGAATGGPFTAAIGIAIANRHGIAKSSLLSLPYCCFRSFLFSCFRDSSSEVSWKIPAL